MDRDCKNFDKYLIEPFPKIITASVNDCKRSQTMRYSYHRFTHKEHIQLPNTVWLLILAMSRTQWDQENSRRIRGHGLLMKSYDRFTQIFTESKVFLKTPK
jgi:hypothetical protein